MKPSHPYIHQDGITLLLSILIMSMILVVSVSVSFFATQEIRSSRAAKLSEPAIGAAESAGEQGLWMLKRQGTLADCNTNPAYSSISGSTASSQVRVKRCKRYDSVLINLDANTPLVVLLYDPNNPNDNLCMNAGFNPGAYSGCTGGALISSINVVQNSGNSQVDVKVEDFDQANNWSITDTARTMGTVIDDANLVIPDPIPGSNDERLILTLDPGGFSATVTITALPNGIPTYPTIDAEGCAGNQSINGCDDPGEILKRRINITVPQL